jgi:GNAT superfamily N-acetyltransferase
MYSFNIFRTFDEDVIHRLEEFNKESWDWLPIPAKYWWTIHDMVDGLEVGHAAMRIVDKETVFMGPTYVAPKARGQGLQRKTLAVREEFAVKVLHCSRAISSTLRDNYASANNLIRCGYLLSSPILKPHHCDDLWWTKELGNEIDRGGAVEHMSAKAFINELRAWLDRYSRP